MTFFFSRRVYDTRCRLSNWLWGYISPYSIGSFFLFSLSVARCSKYATTTADVADFSHRDYPLLCLLHFSPFFFFFGGMILMLACYSLLFFNTFFFVFLNAYLFMFLPAVHLRLSQERAPVIEFVFFFPQAFNIKKKKEKRKEKKKRITLFETRGVVLPLLLLLFIVFFGFTTIEAPPLLSHLFWNLAPRQRRLFLFPFFFFLIIVNCIQDHGDYALVSFFFV